MEKQEQQAALDRITVFADEAHGDQKRKYTGEDYIVHPVSVMKICQEYSDDIVVSAAALLHDVLEDTPVTEQGISDFLHSILSPEKADKIVRTVVELTDIYTKKAYPRHNRRGRKQLEGDRLAVTSYEAQTVKYADIIDNSLNIIQHDNDFGLVYLKECRDILKKMSSGHPDLYQRAVTTVYECLQTVRDAHRVPDKQKDL